MKKIKKLFASLILITAVFSLYGCALRSKDIEKPLAYPNCIHGSLCSASGIFSIEEIDHVAMGKIKLADDKCVNISLSKSGLKKAEKNLQKNVDYVGVLYSTPGGDESTFKVEIEGRRVGWDQCSDTFIFVK